MTGVILAAGLSSRLRPLTDSLPKALLAIGGKPLLQRTLESLLLPCIDRVVVVTGFLHTAVETFIDSLQLPIPVITVHNSRYASTGNNYSLWLAGPRVLGDAMLLLDCDILFAREILTLLLDAPCANALVVRSGESVSEEEVKVVLTTSGNVRQIGKEIPKEAAMGESVGIEKFSGSAVRTLYAALDRRRTRNEFYEAAFQEIIDGGTEIAGIDCGSLACMEIDTPDDLREAEVLASTYPL